ncbi:MAG: type II toxin-antitoxin system RelE/ParE family toxin [Xanthobacteraceae bacterium]|nr:type II toxin-antitoxin system RelE/ParE family toxin [Xanthobacteraceae bacterium]
MEVEFVDEILERLEREFQFTGGFSAEIVRAFRKRMALVRSAIDERDFYQMKGAHFEKLKGSRSHQRSMRLNKQWRLVMELSEGASEKTVKIVSIEDYH